MIGGKGPNMNRLTKTSEVGKQQLLLAHGALDTKINANTQNMTA